METELLRRKVLSWLVVITGVALGVVLLAQIGAEEISPTEGRFRLVIWIVIGVVSVIGSALRTGT